MLLAKAREELIEKRLVEKQAAYLLVSLRQKILNLPATYGRRLLGITDAKVMQAQLKEVAVSLLEELRDLPAKVTNPNWLETVEDDDAAAKQSALPSP
jgi:hypothetical protein